MATTHYMKALEKLEAAGLCREDLQTVHDWDELLDTVCDLFDHSCEPMPIVAYVRAKIEEQNTGH